MNRRQEVSSSAELFGGSASHCMKTRWWKRTGRVANGNLSEYHVRVNADIGEIDVSALNMPDMVFNSVGVRGIGEIGITGTAAAVCNAVFHATGIRVRDLPITLDKLYSLTKSQ